MVSGHVPSSSGSGVDEWVYGRQAKCSASSTTQLLERWNKARRSYWIRLSPCLPEDRSSPVIDVGCGEGCFLWFLQQAGYCRCTGVDLDEGRTASARSMGLDVLTGDCLAYMRTAQPDCYAMVAATDLLEHLTKEEALELVQSTYRALRPDGVLFVRMPCTDGPFGACHAFNDLTHKWACTSQVLRGLLLWSGFSDVAVSDERPMPYNLVNVLRLASFHAITSIASLVLRFSGLGAPRIWTRSMWAIARK